MGLFSALYTRRPAFVAMKLKDAFTDAEVPGVGEVDTTDPVSWGKVIVGATVLTLAVSAGSYAAGEVKGITGAENVGNPLENTLGDF